jgi:hypothetical protein
MLFARVMNASCQMHDSIDTDERFCPISVRADSVNDNRICVGRGFSHSLSNDHHSVGFQCRHNISADEAIRTRYQDNKSAIRHSLFIPSLKGAPARYRTFVLR